MSTESSTKSISYISVGLAVFSMLFGAGNLMYPIMVGAESGSANIFGLAGFLITAVLLPLIGIFGMILFDGDYKTFFYRLGKIPGFLSVLACMLIIGPGLALPRIVTLSHMMMSPFLPVMSPFVFAIIFLGVTFFFTFRESKIIDILGKFISPILLISLIVIIVKGFLTASIPVAPAAGNFKLFLDNLELGYGTMDLFGAIFFSSIILSILKAGMPDSNDAAGLKRLANFGLKSGSIGVGLLALVYSGMSLLGVYHSHDFANVSKGELFRAVSFKVLGCYGAAVIGIAVLFACLSTSIALFAVLGEYIQKEVFNNKVGFVASLAILFVLCLPLSSYGLDYIIELAKGPILLIGYPVLITITFCNIVYKLWGFKYIKLPVIVIAALGFAKYLLF